MSPKEIKKELESMGFIHSDFKQYRKDVLNYNNSGLKEYQVQANSINITFLNSTLTAPSKYYYLIERKSFFDIKAWCY